MDLKIEEQLFVITGATSGLGNAVLRRVVEEGARVIAVAQRGAGLGALEKEYPGQVEGITGNVTDEDVLDMIVKAIGERSLHSIFVNAGAPRNDCYINHYG